MFVDINTQQVKVARNLVNELISNLNIEDEDPRKRLEAICARVVLNMGGDRASPVKDRVLTIGSEKTNWQCLTLTSLVDGLEDNNLIGSVQRPSGRNGAPVLQPGPLGHLSGEAGSHIRRAQDVLQRYFALFATGAPAHWQLGDAKGGYLCTNLGLRALLVLLRPPGDLRRAGRDPRGVAGARRAGRSARPVDAAGHRLLRIGEP